MGWQRPFAVQSIVVALSAVPSPCSAQNNDSTSSSSTSPAAIAALGTIIGYIGSEVVDEEIFERLLWPERFYNNASLRTLLEFAVFFPMGGPLHSAAIHALISLRKSKTYLGARQGHMLDTPFYTDLQTKYYARSHETESKIAKEARNALLIRILRLVNSQPNKVHRSSPPSDSESQPEIRTTIFIQHLKIRYATNADLTNKKYFHISESFSWRTVVGLVCSELSALILAPIVGFRLGSWFGFWFCTPLFLKIVAAVFRVRREPLKIHRDDSTSCIFEAVENDRWFFVIEGPETLIRQFFRHYGHPKRDTRGVMIGDRINEVVSMMTIVLFGTIFPVGLLAVTLWLDVNVQFTWLGYQLWVSLVMLISRLVEGNRWGTTEQRIAKELSEGNQVVFENQAVMTLDTTVVGKVDRARAVVQELVTAVSKNIRKGHGQSDGDGDAGTS